MLMAGGALAISTTAACAETPRCKERGDPPQLVPECNAKKAAVCGDREEELYDPLTGALLPLSPREDGSCDGVIEPCRPRPLCRTVDEPPSCPGGRDPLCLLGEALVGEAP